MNSVGAWIRGAWFVPCVAGTLIALSFLIEALGDGRANAVVGPQW